MNIKEAKKKLTKLIKNPLTADKAIMMWGPSGVGKSAIVYQIAEELKMKAINIALNKINPVDFMGIPVYDKQTNRMVWATPNIFPYVERDGERGILFLDEINTAPMSVQAAAYQLVLDRKIGEYALPKGWIIIAAGNRSKDKGATYKMPAPLVNRFIAHLNIEPDIDAFTEYAFSKGFEPEIIGFLKWKPDLLHQQPTEIEEGTNFPTPRAWENANLLREVYDNDTEFVEALGECINRGVATTFQGYLKVFDKLPDMNKILVGQIKKMELDINKPDLMYALSVSLVYRLLKKPDVKKIDNALKYINQTTVTYSYLVAKEIASKIPNKALESKEFEKYAQEHADLILAA
jgi:ABC-type branched-subunit amino acid transport system ATPase component